MPSKLLNLTPEQIVTRAKSCLGDYVKYRLDWPNGGSNPETEKPYAKYKIDGVTFNVADCIGFAVWCQGISRRFTGTDEVPKFPDTPNIAGSYINCTSIIEESAGFTRPNGTKYAGGRFFKRVNQPQPGDLIVYSGKTKQYPKSPKHGHIAVVVAVPQGLRLMSERVEDWITLDTRNSRSELRVIHCSASSDSKTNNKAIKETDARTWLNKDAMFLRLNRELFTRSVV